MPSCNTLVEESAMMIQTPYTNMTFFAMVHILSSVTVAILTKLFSTLIEFFLSNVCHIDYSWVHELTEKVRNVDQDKTNSTGQNNYKSIVLRSLIGSWENRIPSSWFWVTVSWYNGIKSHAQTKYDIKEDDTSKRAPPAIVDEKYWGTLARISKRTKMLEWGKILLIRLWLDWVMASMMERVVIGWLV